jgi:chemotaxis protein methyltransferase CheR
VIAGWSKSQFFEACSIIESWIGVRLHSAAPHRLREFLARRARSLALGSPADYLALLHSAEPTHPERRELVNLVTNGLTAFWRDPPQLDALGSALEELFPGRGRPLSVWCAGCSTGEEPYTIAMIAAERGVDIDLLATDINTEFLSIARRGRYGAWSLRRLDASRRDLYFEDDDGAWTISPELRASIRFREHNLVEAPPIPPHGEGWDVILCRNVLIYFDLEPTKKVLERFASVLHPDGYLMLGSSEQVPDAWQFALGGSPLRGARHGQGFVYRLSTTPPGTTIYGLESLRFDELEELARAPVPAASLHPPLDEDTAEIDMDQEGPIVTLLDDAVSCAGARDYEDALALAEAAACYDPFAADAHYLMAALLRQRGSRSRAADALRRVLFLRPSHWLAAFDLAQLLERLGEPDRARRAYLQCLDGMRRLDTPLFERDSVSRLFSRASLHADAVREACDAALARLATP